MFYPQSASINNKSVSIKSLINVAHVIFQNFSAVQCVQEKIMDFCKTILQRILIVYIKSTFSQEKHVVKTWIVYKSNNLKDENTLPSFRNAQLAIHLYAFDRIPMTLA